MQIPAARAKTATVLKLYRNIWRELKGERRVFVGAILLLVSAQLVLLAVPYFSGKALNALQLHGTQGFREAAWALSTVLAIAVVSWLFHGPARLLERRGALLIRERMSASLIEHLLRLPLNWHEAHHSGATAHRVQQSTQALSGFAQSQFIYLNSTVRLVGPLIALFWVEPLLGGAALSGFALIICSVLGFDRAMLKLANEENDAERRYAATLIDTLGNTTSVYALRQGRGVGARLQRRLREVFVPLRRAIVLNELKWVTVDLATRLLNCALVGLYVWLATRGEVSRGLTPTLLLGSLFMVWEYGQQAAGVVASIASNFQTFARQHADYASADLIRDSVPQSAGEGSVTPVASWQRMAIRDLSFRHATARSGAPALERLSLHLERGKRYALIGASGSGKSTLLRVMAGLYQAERIAITLDDGPTQVCAAEALQLLRGCVTLIPQDAEVYEGTLGENLGLCESVHGAPTPDAYAQALEAACATDFVEASPAGLEVPVAERASNWSGGQRSRVALARGILAASGSAIVLLDEPTASLDPDTEARVYTRLFATFTDACLISSIHRMSLLDRFDEVLVMQEGRLIAQGRIDELALTCGEFKRLMMLQGTKQEPASVLEKPVASVRQLRPRPSTNALG
jgi:ABC-type multidrug transport system fused ATPase/permease subunit